MSVSSPCLFSCKLSNWNHLHESAQCATIRQHTCGGWKAWVQRLKRPSVSLCAPCTGSLSYLSASPRNRCSASWSFDIISFLGFRECSSSGFPALLLAASSQDHFKPSIIPEIKVGMEGHLLFPCVCSLLGRCQSLSPASGNGYSGGPANLSVLPSCQGQIRSRFRKWTLQVSLKSPQEHIEMPCMAVKWEILNSIPGPKVAMS